VTAFGRGIDSGTAFSAWLLSIIAARGARPSGAGGDLLVAAQGRLRAR
jgi:hypothetical protein